MSDIKERLRASWLPSPGGLTDEAADEIERLERELAALRHDIERHIEIAADAHTELAQCREDAERYRWLFEDVGNSVTARVAQVYRAWDGQSDWHAAIDAARASEPPSARP